MIHLTAENVDLSRERFAPTSNRRPGLALLALCGLVAGARSQESTAAAPGSLNAGSCSEQKAEASVSPELKRIREMVQAARSLADTTAQISAETRKIGDQIESCLGEVKRGCAPIEAHLNAASLSCAKRNLALAKAECALQVASTHRFLTSIRQSFFDTILNTEAMLGDIPPPSHDDINFMVAKALFIAAVDPLTAADLACQSEDELQTQKAALRQSIAAIARTDPGADTLLQFVDIKFWDEASQSWLKAQESRIDSFVIGNGAPDLDRLAREALVRTLEKPFNFVADKALTLSIEISKYIIETRLSKALPLLGKFVGGVFTLYDMLEPVELGDATMPAAFQVKAREALHQLAKERSDRIRSEQESTRDGSSSSEPHHEPPSTTEAGSSQPTTTSAPVHPGPATPHEPKQPAAPKNSGPKPGAEPKEPKPSGPSGGEPPGVVLTERSPTSGSRS